MSCGMDKPPFRVFADTGLLTRRSFAKTTGAFAAAGLLGARAQGPEGAPAARKHPAAAGSRKSGYPFTLGVASGDPTSTGVVLWTRLAPTPFAPGGGMGAEAVDVEFQVAADEGMTRIVASGKAPAGPQWAHTVHVEVEGLQPDSWYWYQFKVGEHVSPLGRTRTLPPASAMPEKLRFAFVSCQHYEQGYYTAFDHLAREAPDLVIHLGDYIYEGGSHEGLPRKHNGRACKDLEDYRARYALYKTDPMLQHAHEVAPWFVTWDDHEVAGNYAGMIPKDAEPPGEFVRRRAAGYQAYFEHMPLRRSALPKGPEMLLYRGFDFGKLASFQMLDTRQYRTDQPMGDGVKAAGAAAMSPAATILGADQRKWLYDRLSASTATWNVIAQQVMMARVDLEKGPEAGFNMDKWPGYEMDRRNLIRHLQDRKVPNPVIITGDIHSNWANEIINDFDQDRKREAAVEFVGTSISSGGDGEEGTKRNRWIMAENPFVKFRNDQRGYVMCEVTPRAWIAKFRVVDQVSKPGAAIRTRATFRVDPGSSKLVPV